jgi:hypothetical protein
MTTWPLEDIRVVARFAISQPPDAYFLTGKIIASGKAKIKRVFVGLGPGQRDIL